MRLHIQLDDRSGCASKARLASAWRRHPVRTTRRVIPYDPPQRSMRWSGSGRDQPSAFACRAPVGAGAGVLSLRVDGEGAEYDLVEQLLNRRDVFVDVGTNVGTFSVHPALQVGRATALSHRSQWLPRERR